jgi:glyoxylase-like metal-dependent hydrolase (beta-lactamase superfamily II)
MSAYFELQQLAEGIYAAVMKAAGGNSGFVDLGDGVLIFDTTAMSAPVGELIEASQEITGHPLIGVVNSHLHFDHILGNWAIPESVDIIATPLTTDLIVKRVLPYLEEQRRTMPGTLQGLEAQLQTEQDEITRQGLAEQIASLRTLLAESHALEARLPTRTFQDRLVFEGSARRVELIELAGHTESDTILYLPAEHIVFTGDLFVNGAHPWMLESNPEAWLRALTQIEALHPIVAVPGHGPLGDQAGLTAMREYITLIPQLAAETAARGGSADEIPVPAAYAGYPNGSTFAENLRHFIDKAS